jgi:tetratricopeptide (TPR) repeat protein
MNKKLLFIILSLMFLLSAPSIFAETINTSKQPSSQQTITDIPAGTAQEYYNRGNIYGKQGNLTQAISDYTKAIEINPKYTEAYYNRGNTYEKQGNLTQAISDYTKAIEINPKYTAAYCNRGNAYQTQGNLKEAISDYTKALEINPNFAGVYINRGDVYQTQGNLPLAIADYNKAIEINPNFAGVYTNRGNVYQTQGNLPLAIADYNKALEISPNDSTSLYNRGLAYYGAEQYGKALTDYTTAISQNPNKEAYEDFIKNVPEKKTSDTKNVRNEIVQLFAEKLNSDKKTAIAAPAPAPAFVADAPVVTTDNLAPVDIKQNETKSASEEAVRNLVTKWLIGWKSGDMKTYRSCYTSDFQSKGINLNAWISYKNNVRQRSKNINISIDDLQISVDENSAIAVFTQSYSSSILKDKGKKTLELKKINDEWKIYSEVM